MKFTTLAVTGVSLIAIAAATAASAQVSAQEVWDSWKANLGTYGSEGVTIGAETYAGGVLTVSDIVVSFADPSATFGATIGSLVFTEQVDGTVSITMSEEVPITITAAATDETEEMSIDLWLRQQDLEMVVGGTVDAMTYDVSATRYSVNLDNVSDGSATGSGSLVLNNLSGTYSVTLSDMQVVEYDLAASSLDLGMNLDDPDESVVFGMKGSIADITSTASFVLPLPENTTPDTILMDGLTGKGSYSLGETSIAFEMTADGNPVSGTAKAAGSALTAEVSADSLAYSSNTSGLSVEASSPALPFPINVSFSEYGMNFAMPLAATKEPVDFAFGINLTDLTVNEEIWAMADPGAVLPHDPATLILDLTGTARLFFDLADPAQAAALADTDVPGEVHSVSLNNLTISAIGAGVRGNGAFTFDNSDITTIPGVPRPEGKLELSATGLNGLMDNLVTMGLLPEEQVMGARMMLGLFTVPTGDDQLTTTIEVNAEGQILANGQRLQ